MYVDLRKNYRLSGGTPYSELCVSVDSITVGTHYMKLSYSRPHSYDQHVGNYWRVNNILCAVCTFCYGTSL